MYEFSCTHTSSGELQDDHAHACRHVRVCYVTHVLSYTHVSVLRSHQFVTEESEEQGVADIVGVAALIPDVS